MTHHHAFEADEIAKFDALASKWWDLKGELRTLHALDPVRMEFIQKNFALKGKRVLDVGCGGGILSESLAKAGAMVTGIDRSPNVIKVATEHATKQQLSIDYQCIDLETFISENKEPFDGIVCMELLEHVDDPENFIQQLKYATTPASHLFFSTINRTLKAYLQAILAAEYVLNLLPKKTHDYEKFIKPSELASWLRHSNFTLKSIIGVHYNPLTHEASMKDDVGVNYMVHAICD